jgi:hypothetical protein
MVMVSARPTSRQAGMEESPRQESPGARESGSTAHGV